MSGLRYIEKLANGAWLCDQEHVEFLHSIFLRYLDRAAAGQPLDTETVEQTLGRPLDNTREVTVKDGVARIPVEGTIVRRANLFTQISGGVSTEMIAKDFTTAYNDSTVHSILFVFDSPGGEATGIGELASLIREKRDLGEKRIEAYCDGLCASGAYWLASATERITTDPTAALGSIGVVSRVRNPEAAGKKLTLEFWNSRSPKKRMDPNSYEGQEAIQAYVDDMGDEFIAAVADNRGVPFEKVAEDFGQGFVLVGRKAVEAGMADAIGTEGSVVERLQRREGFGELKLVRPSSATAEVGAALASWDPLDGWQRIETPAGFTFTALPVTQAKEAANLQTETRENGREITEETEARGLVARIREMISGSGEALAEMAVDDQTPKGASGTMAMTEGNRTREENDEDMAERHEEETVSAEETGVGRTTADLEEENRELRGRVAELEARVEELTATNASAQQSLKEERVDRELAAFGSDGVPKFMLDQARPDLLEEGEDEPSKARAERWRTVLGANKGAIEYGERGDSGADGKGDAEMSDDERVKATLEERGLGMASYGDVAAELAAQGEIRQAEPA